MPASLATLTSSSAPTLSPGSRRTASEASTQGMSHSSHAACGMSSCHANGKTIERIGFSGAKPASIREHTTHKATAHSRNTLDFITHPPGTEPALKIGHIKVSAKYAAKQNPY